MSRTLRAAVALALTLAAGLLTIAPAQAHAAPNDDVTVAATCYFRVDFDGVRVRTKPSTSSTAVGLVYRGTYLRSSGGSTGCVETSGGSYTACRGSANVWASVIYNGYRRYVASMCVTPVWR
ncbi:MAG: SH3 domain-containing protein [Micromonosporaceae bacterium]